MLLHGLLRAVHDSGIFRVGLPWQGLGFKVCGVSAFPGNQLSSFFCFVADRPEVESTHMETKFDPETSLQILQHALNPRFGSLARVYRGQEQKPRQTTLFCWSSAMRVTFSQWEGQAQTAPLQKHT